MTTITIEYDDGRRDIIQHEEFIEACVKTIAQMRMKTGSPASPPRSGDGPSKSGVSLFQFCDRCRGIGVITDTGSCGFMRCDVCRGSGRSTADLRNLLDDEQRAKACQTQVDIQGGEL